MNSFIHGNETSDIRLVAALGGMGIRCDEKGAGGALQTRNGVVRTWNLSQLSNCGLWKLGDLIKWWRDKEFHVTNPAHPFNRVKCAMASCKAYSEALSKHKGIGFAARGESKIAVVMEHATGGNMVHGYHPTDDFTKCAALMAMGFNATEVRMDGSHRSMQIQAFNEKGHPFAPLEIAWNDNRFHEVNPQHPFAYVKAALWNYQFLVNAIKRDKPLVDISRGESFAYLHPDCSARTEEQILSQFDK